MTIAALLAVAACNGDDDAATTTVTVQPSQPGSTTAETATETTGPPTTSTSNPPPTTETTPPTTAPRPTTEPTAETTDPPTTTDQPVDDFAAQTLVVIERTEASWEIVLAAFRDPLDDAKVEALDEYFTGNQLEGFNNLIDLYRADGVRAVAREGMSDTYEVEPRSLALDLEGGRATVQVCHIETSLVVETAGNPDGTDRVISDDIEQQIVEVDLVLADGTWKASTARTPETEIATCSST